jgi:hypothetical protein
MADPNLSIVDCDLPLNQDFYDLLVAEMAAVDVTLHYYKVVDEVPSTCDLILMASPTGMQGVASDSIVLGLRTINRRERLEIAAQVVPENLIARWASPPDEGALSEVLSTWGERKNYVFKYDWSAGRRGVSLHKLGEDHLPEDYDPGKDIVMEYLDDDPYTYKADLCCSVLLNSWFLRTESITAGNFNEYTRNPTQYDLPQEVRVQLEVLSRELMRYGSGYISVDMMQYQGEFKIIEINTNAVGRNISWKRFGETYLKTYPEGLQRMLKAKPTLPRLGVLRELRNLENKILPPLKAVN